MRLLDRGFVHLYLPEAVAVHMKPPSPEFNLPITLRNFRHFAYLAAKLMTPVDALLVLASLLLHTVVGALREDRRTIQGVPHVLAGFVAGLRRRAPARPVVSHTYRQNWRYFAWPWRFMRSPTERWRAVRHRERIEEQRLRRQLPFFAGRPDLYPVGRASLKL